MRPEPAILPKMSGGGSPIPSLTGLRFLAAGLVVVYHLYANGHFPGYSHLKWLLSQGNAGVSFFFILSGFVLTWSYKPSTTRRRFYRRRVARVVPVYLVTLILGLIVSIYAGLRIGWLSLLTIPLLQSWIPTPDAYFAVNGPAWSLSDEAFFYAVFPFLVAAILRLSARVRLIAAGLMALLPIVTAAAGSYVSRTHANLGYWLFFIAPPIRLAEFVIGILVASFVIEGRWPQIPLRAAWPITIAGYLIAGLFPLNFFKPVVFTVVPFAVLIGTYAHRATLGAGADGVFSRPMLQRLGAWSYSVYLIHMSVLLATVAAVAKLTGSDLASRSVPLGLAVGLGVFAVAVAMAAFAFTYVEAPSEKQLAGRTPVTFAEEASA